MMLRRLPAALVGRRGGGTGAASGPSTLGRDNREERLSEGRQRALVEPSPPSLPQSSHPAVAFRGGTASYNVLDAASALSRRWLVWTESGVPYLLMKQGLTDLEFWQVANSLM
jgi:hypothetical protein